MYSLINAHRLGLLPELEYMKQINVLVSNATQKLSFGNHVENFSRAGISTYLLFGLSLSQEGLTSYGMSV
jgi:hypothetical protein